MHLELLDALIIAAYLVLALAVGLALRRKGGKDLTAYFLGSRNLPWWLAGISMVATTFAADTPLAVTELVGKNGVAGNWIWWNMLLGGMLTTFFFARYWRRAQVLTDLEFISLRYSGKPARFLRGFRAIYFGLFINALIIGWVNLALMALLEGFFGFTYAEQLAVTGGAMLLVVVYTGISGLLGVVYTDAIQFTIAITGSIVLAVMVLQAPEIGGLHGLKMKLPDNTLDFFPVIGESAGQTGQMLVLGAGTFFAYIGIQWWASWYPGNEPGGGGYIAQRMMSAKNESHAIKASLLFQLAHYCLRPWPWILVALSALILYPELGEDTKRLGYVYAMRDYLPSGMKGLLLVAFFAAYMSTLSTQLNWGTSYLVHDFYQAYLQPKSSQRKLVWVSRMGTLLLSLVALGITAIMDTITQVWELLLEGGAGLGLVLILRWYWWRVNAWSEITATIMPFFAYLLAHEVLGLTFPNSFFVIVGITTISWLVVTWLTPPTEAATLDRFYRRVQPLGAWPANRNSGRNRQLMYLGVSWAAATCMAYGLLFLTGYALFGFTSKALLSAGVTVLSFLMLMIVSKKTRAFHL